MSYKVITIRAFDKQAKRLLKRYPSLKAELLELITILKSDPTHGTELGNQCYKIRLAISSKRKGKSGGGVITHFYVVDDTVILLSIYDKSEQVTISDKH
jgi:mRNA-degrading endonuclease RelE of RelBE toxin-antitoxin system